MSLINNLLRHFGTKVFLTYLALILVMLLIVGVAMRLALPDALGRHMQGMGGMGGQANGPGAGPDLALSLRSASNEAFLLAAGVALLVAVGLSVWLSRELAAPLQRITAASQALAVGRYEERVEVSGAPEAEQDEIGRLALSFNQMAAELEQTEALRRQLIGDVSHELRTPLTAIKGYVEGLMDGVVPANADTYQQIHREADRLQRLVADLQELSRVQSGGFVLEKKPVLVAELFQALSKRMAKQFEDKAVRLEIREAGDLPMISGDEDRIGQVLLNLASNALQYTPPGGRVMVAARQQGSFVEFEMADSGSGIPAEHLPHIFNRFYRVDKSRSRAEGGSGIGLTIAKHLVESHGGRIWVESQGAGRGSTFRFTIPLVRH